MLEQTEKRDNGSDRTPVMEATSQKISRKEIFRNGSYPYSRKLSRREYEKLKAELQIELLKVQSWVKDTGQGIVILLLYGYSGRSLDGYQVR